MSVGFTQVDLHKYLSPSSQACNPGQSRPRQRERSTRRVLFNFVNFVTGHEPGDCYGKKTFYRIVKDGSEHAKEVGTNCHYFQFPGQGQKSTPCMTIRGLQRLLMILGGKVATEYREIVESVFTRYTAGDTSLIEEVRANAVSDAPENVSKQCL